MRREEFYKLAREINNMGVDFPMASLVPQCQLWSKQRINQPKARMVERALSLIGMRSPLPTEPHWPGHTHTLAQISRMSEVRRDVMQGASAQSLASKYMVSVQRISQIKRSAKKHRYKINQWEKAQHNWNVAVGSYAKFDNARTIEKIIVFDPIREIEFFMDENEYKGPGGHERKIVMGMYADGFKTEQIAMHLKVEKKEVYRMKYKQIKIRKKILSITS